MKGLVILSLVVVGLVGGIGSAIASWRFPGWGGKVIVVAAGVNLLACWLAFLPLAAALRWARRALPQAVVSATAIRLVLVSLVGWAVCVFGYWRAEVLVIWLVVFYLSLLSVETVWAVRLVNRRTGNTDGSTKT